MDINISGDVRSDCTPSVIVSSKDALLDNFRSQEIDYIAGDKWSKKENFAKFSICNIFFNEYYLIFKSLNCLNFIYLFVYI